MRKVTAFSFVRLPAVSPIVTKPMVRVKHDSNTLMAKSFFVSRERDNPCSILSLPTACKNAACFTACFEGGGGIQSAHGGLGA